ncbi:PAS domain-containing sensor histidine kinase [Desulfosporosinus sp. Sb-LF]|uniref:PAS domain-containing sensor histidine kinase n=1 Tax=Desulfosporosinus sp. Sb-LF TaxID=2560027 RepID=UPI00107EFDD6|nr:PAS domain-containing sensor histidine kinase [Desulfosporosinus sp. Sb-LF]TGE34551.1 PAS domain-containing sensor histidine kinase [Desulfosporosinus sp. Sb-LF]
MSEYNFFNDEQSVRSLFENMLYGFAYHKVVYDIDGRPIDYIFVQTNDAFQKLTGLKTKDIIGKSVLEVLPNTESYWIETYCRVTTTGSAEKFENYSQELNKWFEVTVCSTKKDHFAVIFNDITATKTYNLIVAESEDRFRCLVEHSQDALYRRNYTKNEYEYLSPVIEKIIGYSVEELKTMPFDIVLAKVHPEDLPHVTKTLIETSQGGEIVTEMEYRFLCKNGTYRWLSDRFTSSSKNEENQLFRYGVVQDITERKIAEEKIKKQEYEIAQLDRLSIVGEMAATLAHEIRNPMTVVMGYCQLMSQNFEGKSLERFQLIINEIKSINQVIENFLPLARNKGIVMKDHSINDLITSEYPLFYAACVNKGIRIILDLSDCLPNVIIDIGEIKQVIFNIVRNATDSMDYSGTLRISTWVDHQTNQAILCITDTGSGINEEDLGKIFNPFYTTKTDGTGLGLGVCKRIMQRHNGSITVNSKVGIGTTVQIAFPIS